MFLTVKYIKINKENQLNHKKQALWGVAENWRFDAALNRMASLMKEGIIGRPIICSLIAERTANPSNKYLKTAWRAEPKYRGGFLLDAGVHFIAALRFVAGDSATSSFSIQESKTEDINNNNDNTNDSDSNGFIHANGKHQQDRRINGSMPKRLLPLFDAAELLESPNGEVNGNEDYEFHLTKFELEKKRFAIEEEVDHVYERLQALEADREFLKHCMGSLRKGDKGLDLLQEILQHLRDLKSVELQAMKNPNQCASV